MPKEFIMRGQTPVGEPHEILNMTGHRPGYGYVITEFKLYPSTAIGTQGYEMTGSITANNVTMAPDNPDFNSEGLIATAFIQSHSLASNFVVINDLFVITQDLLLQVADTEGQPVNWQIKFKEVKLSASAEAVANYQQYTIYNTSQ